MTILIACGIYALVVCLIISFFKSASKGEKLDEQMFLNNWDENSYS